MSKLQCRGSIALAAVVVALLWSRPANAQIVAPDPTRHHGSLLDAWVAGGTGIKYDIVNQAQAEHRLQKVEAKLRRDSERGHGNAVDHDLRRIDNLRYRIVVDEWLIRKNSLLDPGNYPYPLRMDAMSCEAIAMAARPPEFPTIPQSAPTPRPMVAGPTIPITIVNAGPIGSDVAFAIGGIAHQVAGDSRQDLIVAAGSDITYDGGGSIGQRRYQISSGVYEFRSTAEGRALYKLAGMR